MRQTLPHSVINTIKAVICCYCTLCHSVRKQLEKHLQLLVEEQNNPKIPLCFMLVCETSEV